jgi:hypothetical protein
LRAAFGNAVAAGILALAVACFTSLRATIYAPEMQFTDRLLLFNALAVPSWMIAGFAASVLLQWTPWRTRMTALTCAMIAGLAAMSTRGSGVWVNPFFRWMKMDHLEGHIVAFFRGRKIPSVDALPQRFFDRLSARHPQLLNVAPERFAALEKEFDIR